MSKGSFKETIMEETNEQRWLLPGYWVKPNGLDKSQQEDSCNANWIIQNREANSVVRNLHYYKP